MRALGLLVVAISGCDDPAPTPFYPAVAPAPAQSPATPLPAPLASLATPSPSAPPGLDRPAAAAPPTVCTPRSATVTLATASRAVRDAEVAQRGDRTAVVWVEGSRGKLVLVDGTGRLVMPATDLTEAGDVDGPFVLHVTDGGFLVVWVHKHGPNLSHVDLVSREVAGSGTMGPTVRLLPDFRDRSWSSIWANGSLLVAHSSSRRLGIVTILRGPTGRELTATATLELPGQASIPPGITGKSPDASVWGIGRTPVGFSVAWSVWREGRDADQEIEVRVSTSSQVLDAEGRVRGERMPLQTGRYHRVDWDGTRWVVPRVRSGAFELAAVPISPGSVWDPIPASRRIEAGRLARVAGRTWAVLAAGGDAGFVVPLGDDHRAAGAPIPVIWDAFDIDPSGTGAAVSWSNAERELAWQPLQCL